jgi:hypothetical protein
MGPQESQSKPLKCFGISDRDALRILDWPLWAMGPGLDGADADLTHRQDALTLYATGYLLSLKMIHERPLFP